MKIKFVVIEENCVLFGLKKLYFEIFLMKYGVKII